jgi:integrase
LPIVPARSANLKKERKEDKTMAYFRKRGDTWSYTIETGRDPVTGKRKQKTEGGFRLKADAQAAVNLLENDLINKKYVNESEIIFEKYAEQWIKKYETMENVKISTVYNRKTTLKKWVSLFGGQKLKGISKGMYEEALLGLLEKGYSHNTLKGFDSCMKILFARAVADGLVKTDPTANVKLPRRKKTVEELEAEEPLPKFLEKNDLNTFLAAAKNYPVPVLYELFLTLAYTGMRIGEAVALKWRDIDFDEAKISITKTYFNPKGIRDYILLTPKTKTSRRVIDVDKAVLKTLSTMKAKQNLIKMRYQNAYHNGDFVFAIQTGYLGYPVYSNTVGKHMKKILRKCGLDTSLSPHSLRHTHISILAAAGVGLDEIQARVGHAAASKTTRLIYLHVTEHKKKEAVAKFSEYLNS